MLKWHQKKRKLIKIENINRNYGKIIMTAVSSNQLNGKQLFANKLCIFVIEEPCVLLINKK